MGVHPFRRTTAEVTISLNRMVIDDHGKIGFSLTCKIGVRIVKYTRMPMDYEESLKQLKEALQTHHQALEKLETVLVEFEQIILGEATLRPQQEDQRGGGVELLSIPQLCQELGMGKSWIYRRLRSGDIPSVRLGRTIKVRRDELEEYLESHHYPARAQVLQEEDSPSQ